MSRDKSRDKYWRHGVEVLEWYQNKGQLSHRTIALGVNVHRAQAIVDALNEQDAALRLKAALAASRASVAKKMASA